MDISIGKAHLHTSHKHFFFFLRKFTVKLSSWTETPCDNILLTMPDLIFTFCLPASQKPSHGSLRCMCPCLCVRVCVSVWEALDIKVNFNKVWRLAGGIGETCQAQTLSLCVPSHPVFTSSGQLAAFSVCRTSWQFHIFHYEFYMNINNQKSLEFMTVTVKLLMLTVYGKC